MNNQNLSESLIVQDNMTLSNSNFIYSQRNKRNGPIVDCLAFDNYCKTDINNINDYPDIKSDKRLTQDNQTGDDNKLSNRNSSRVNVIKLRNISKIDLIGDKLEYNKYNSIKDRNENNYLKIAQSMNLIQNSDRKNIRLIKTKHNLFRFKKI